MKTHVQKPIEIALSKTKLILLFLAALGFVGLALWFIVMPQEVASASEESPLKILLASYAGLLFFGLGSFYFARKLFDRRPGLILDAQGLTDNSSLLPFGRILWADVEDIGVGELYGQNFVLLKLADPKRFISQEPSWIKRMTFKANLRSYATPTAISANGLKISFAELLPMICEAFAASRGNSSERFH